MEKIKWLIINYNLPSEPSRYRVAVWRGLKKLGAINIQQSMWVLPSSESNYSSLQKISQEIESNMGEALLMESEFIEQKQEERIVSIFNTVRDDEYQECIHECEKYIKEIEKEIAKEKFTFAELEEEEAELEKLSSWYKQIEGRDTFKASRENQAKEIVTVIRTIFENYSEMVYNKEVKE